MDYTKNWSQDVSTHSHALTLEPGIFTWDDPKKIAQSLKRSSLESQMRRGTPYQSALSMLSFYINRAGKRLNPNQKAVLNQAKLELAILFGQNY